MLTSRIGIAELKKVAFAITVWATNLLPIARIVAEPFFEALCVADKVMNPHLYTNLLAHDNRLKPPIIVYVLD